MRRLLLLIAAFAFSLPACAAEPAYLRLTSPHFTLITDAGDRDGRQILDNFEHMRWMFTTLFPRIHVDPPEPMVIIAIHGRKAFESFTPADRLSHGQLKLAGYFLDGPDRHMILLRLDAETEHPYDTVYHEYTHLQFRSIQSWMPVWLNEGVAQFFQNTSFRQKEVRVGQPSVNELLFLRQNTLIPLPTLFRVDFKSPYYHEEDKGNIFYAESWALTHYLFIADRQQKTQHLADYLARVGRHEDPVTAAQEAFGDLKALQHALDSYVHAARYMEMVMDATPAQVDSHAYRAEALTAAQFAALHADVLARVGRTDEARALLDALPAEPPLAEAFAARAMLALRTGDAEAGLAACRRAMELGSTDFFLYFHAASLMSNRGGDQAAITAALRRATELNPAYAPAFDMLAEYDLETDGKLDEARSMNLKATQLDPANFHYRLHTGNILLRMNQPESAEAALRMARALATNDADRTMVDERLQEMTAMRRSLRVTGQDSAGSTPADEHGQVLTVNAQPRHPAGPPSGARHTVVGVMDHAECSYPAVLDVELTPTQPGAPLKLYANDFTKIELSSDSGKTADTLNPCQDFNGRTARVVYAESADKNASGQIVSIELSR